MFSFAWYLVNCGSKFWQANWERHVDLLEDITLGPLYKVISVGGTEETFLTSPGQFSVTKLNQILSVFVTLVWVLLLVKSLLPVATNLPPDPIKVIVVAFTVTCIVVLYKC